ncbi:MAG TPA: DPP IV N-terminal domain-containing protein [Candidatus Sulfotelmatobacter sp.]|nr:DPP IV N-terminal domain-containing protein [Candidatus Sulfotelmatobacter sp.]
MNLARHSSIFSLGLFLLTLPQAVAQGTLEDYQRAQQFLPGNLRHRVYVADVFPHWIEKTNRFWYRRTGPKNSEFVLIDAEQNTSAPAFDHVRLAEALSKAAKQEYSATALPFYDIEFVDSGKAIRFSVDSAQWTCTLATYECQREVTRPERANEALSPNKRWAAYVKDHNLYLRDTSTGTRVQLTQDGIAAWDYATPLPSLRPMVDQGTEDVKQPAAVFWSPDSSKLVTYRIDSRNSGRFTSVQFVPPDQLRPKAYTYVYPLPGEVLAKAQPIIFDVESGKRIDVSASIELPFQDGPSFDWFPDSKSFYYDDDERGYKAKELRVVDAATGEQKVLVREQSDSYVDPGETSFRFVEGSREILWTSERDGWNHLYFYSKTGQLLNQITQGPWVVRQIEQIDDKNRRVYFSASGREKNEDPYQTHLYSVGFDGKGLQLLSPENANHSVSVSSDGAFFVDSYSRPDLPGRAVLRRTRDGSEVRVLETSDISELAKTRWKPAEPFQGKAADGTTDLYGLIWRPSNFDSGKKYPIIEFAYTGPQSYFVPKTLGGTLWLQHMAELGFVVVMVDGRGTTGRSRAFHLFSYRNLGGAFEDHVAMIKQMAARYPYMDVTRVGIYGTSAGGYSAAHAMLAFPDFYKVGVSTSGDHDARLDKAWWNELYQGYPVQDDYVAQSNATMAGRLQGHLLLEHGDIDDNVHPVETMRFVDALMKANKNFDMLFVPNMFHGESGEHAQYLVRRRWDYFVQNLLGVTPPSNFEIKEEREPGNLRRRRR